MRRFLILVSAVALLAYPFIDLASRARFCYDQTVQPPRLFTCLPQASCPGKLIPITSLMREESTAQDTR